MNAANERRIKRSLERLVHVLLTHSGDPGESKEQFCRRCAWSVELIIDELEKPGTDGMCSAADAIGSYLAARKRILQRVRSRTENDWAYIPEFVVEDALR